MDMVNQFLSLSLFIMLLSFFIILNAVSSFEEAKARPVLNSISVAFSGAKTEDELAPNVVESVEESSNEGDTLDKLNALFSAHITGVEMRKNRLGTIMHIRMPFDKFERALSLPSNVEGSFLPALSSLVQTRESEVTYRMDMVLNTKDSPANTVREAPDSLKNNLRKITAISQRLEKNGIPKKLVSAGLSKGKENNVDIYFRRYEPFNPAELDEAKVK